MAEGLGRRCLQQPLTDLQLHNPAALLVVGPKPSDDVILLWIVAKAFRGRRVIDFWEEVIEEAHIPNLGKPYVAFQLDLQPRGDVSESRNGAMGSRTWLSLE